MLLIVCLHASVIKRLRVEGSAYWYMIDLPLNLVFWIAVPFFFLASGYFFGKLVERGHEPLELLRESAWLLLLLFCIWVGVYALVPRDWVTAFYNDEIWTTVRTQALKSVAILLDEHIKLLLTPRAPVYHLWFLPGLNPWVSHRNRSAAPRDTKSRDVAHCGTIWADVGRGDRPVPCGCLVPHRPSIAGHALYCIRVVAVSTSPGWKSPCSFAHRGRLYVQVYRGSGPETACLRLWSANRAA
jgi:hypothetical protein